GCTPDYSRRDLPPQGGLRRTPQGEVLGKKPSRSFGGSLASLLGKAI
ncbi:MAG: hypothetical protein AVDCRST_MAG55-1816, partial [uncultured Rubrobacteraceae bacterium]